MGEFLAEIDFSRVKAVFEREFKRYRKRTRKSQALLQSAKKVMPSGVPMAWMSGYYETPPMFIEKGDGAYFYDVDGNRYLDMKQADLAASCGFTPQAVIDAVQEQITKGSAFFHLLNPQFRSLSSWLNVIICPGGNSHWRLPVPMLKPSESHGLRQDAIRY